MGLTEVLPCLNTGDVGWHSLCDCAWVASMTDRSVWPISTYLRDLGCSPLTQMTEFKLTDFLPCWCKWGEYPTANTFNTNLFAFLEKWRRMKEGVGHFSILCCCRAMSNPRPTRLGKKYISPTCWINGHCPILDRRAVGPWTYAGVCANFHFVCWVGFKAVEHVAGLVGRQAELPCRSSGPGFFIGQSVLCDNPISLRQHRRIPRQLHWAACHIGALVHLWVSVRCVLRHTELDRGFLPKAPPVLGWNFEDIGGPSVNAVHRVLSFLWGKFQRG